MKLPDFEYRFAIWSGKVRRQLYRALLPMIVRRSIRISGRLPLNVYCYSNDAMVPEQVRSIRSLLRYAGRPESFTIVSDGSHSARSIELLKKIDPVVDVRPIEEFRPANLPEKLYDFVANHRFGKQLGLIMSLPRSGPALYLDADVLFFRGAGDLIKAAQPNHVPALYLLDCRDFSVDSRLLRQPNEYKNPVNCGFLLLFRPLDWSVCLERYLALDGTPSLFTNQTLTQLGMHANRAQPLDPEQYVLQLDDQCDYRDYYADQAIVVRHYVNPVRHKFWNAPWT